VTSWWSGRVERYVRMGYVRWIRPHLSQAIVRQRVKLAWHVWGYWPVLFLGALSLRNRLKLLVRFIAIDWNVLHAHRPCEIARVSQAIAERSARPNEVMIEAGCWQGGSSAKFSIVCNLFGYRLHIYDSFQGVEASAPKARAAGHDFSGEYAAAEAVVRGNLSRYGESAVCTIHPGWFAETLAARPVPLPVRIVYIDCDLAKGTHEVLRGVVPAMVQDGWVFSQDCHLPSVDALLRDPATWGEFGRPVPQLTRGCRNLGFARL
jgi:O-methyltransferase